MSSPNSYPEDRKTPPYVFLLRIPAGLRLVVALKEGDKAQKTTLKLLEDTQDIMPLRTHNELHERYDRFVVTALYTGN